MREKLRQLKDTLNHMGARTLLTALVVLLAVAVVAVCAGRRIFATEREVLQQRGELNARASAMEYDRYLLTRVNIVTLVGYTVDDMLASGADNEAVRRYITDQTNYIIATLDPGTTGLYGWIGGEYLDGAGWVPDDDYVATERPWYVQTLESDSKITFVEPYLDMQTHTVMMTVSTLLSDGESVVAMDVTLAPIQRIVEQVASSTECSQAFVLNEKGTVVVHSEVKQIGRNLLAGTDALGSAVARRLLLDGELQFDLDTPEGSYSVYVDELEGGWYSVSLINADLWYRPLHWIMAAFYLLLSLTVLFLVLVFLRLNAKNLALERLHTRIDQEERRGDELQELSEKDRMTGLNDRVSGERKVEALLESGCGGMFLELDIDHFKRINDTCGHQTGDRVVLAIAEALRGTFRTNDVTMRLGGDEFGAFAVGIVEREMGEAIIGRLFRRIESIEIPELRGVDLHVSVGAALCADGQKTAFAELYARADGAMYVSKQTPGNRVSFDA